MADADLVLEGGGVKGAGLVGALSVLTGAADPYTFHRIAGTSAGRLWRPAGRRLRTGRAQAGHDKLDFSQFEGRELGLQALQAARRGGLPRFG